MINYKTVYKFYDTDIDGLNEFDICGNSYKKLIKVCCEYCDFFSLIITNSNSELLSKLCEYRIPKNKKITYVFNHYDINSTIIEYFQVSSELCEVLLNNTNSIFSWINGWGYNNPEDPTFYRKDGSVFFTSTIHEGECTLYVQNEDVSEIIASNNWIRVSSNRGT